MEIRNLPLLKAALVVSIIIVLNLFFNFAIKLVYDAPQWEDFCPREQVTIQPKDQGECLARGGAWTENAAYDPNLSLLNAPEAGRLVKPVPITETVRGWCDLNFTCQKEFEAARQVYHRNFFIALVILGLLSIGGSFLVTARSVPALGLSLGGVLSLIVASIRYWSDMDDYLRVIILGLALALLIWLGVKKFKE